MAAAISVTAASSIVKLKNAEHNRHRPIALLASSSSSYSNSLQFGSRLRFGFKGIPSKARPRTFPLVEAKKQTFSNFDDLLKNSDKPVLVDFYATWCGPCQFMVPILDQVWQSMNDQIQIIKIDTEKYPAIADEYKIQALPTFIMFKDGKPCDRFEGAMPADQLIKRIEKALEVKQ